MTFPVHVDPTDEAREAVAPYNFVPLPEKIVTMPVDALPDQGKFHAGRHTGHIDCLLTTESPVFVRAGLNPEQVKQGKQSKDLPGFFYLNDENQPVIPGSSLRGMLRTLVEIVTYSKVTFVSDKKMVYRSVGGATNHDAHYRDMMMHFDGDRDRKKYYTPLIKGGYMVKKGSRDWAIRPAKEVDGVTYAHIHIDEGFFKTLKPVSHTKNAFDVYIRTSPYDYQEVRGGFLKIKYARVQESNRTPAPGLRPATLALSGWMNSKRSEAVVYEPDLQAVLLPLTDDQVDAYTEQISKEQVKLLGEKGVLNDGQPVFYITDTEGQVVFFGHARMFRVPYPGSPFDYIPRDLREPKKGTVDFAEAIFGFLPDDARETGHAGRVSITDARLVPGQNEIWITSTKTIIPKILSGPKPTTFQHYLVQTEPDNYEIGKMRDGKPKTETRLRDFASPTPGETVLRGTKFYWHKGAVGVSDIQESGKVDDKDTQHTRINPLNIGVQFNFRVQFDNLSKEELGALMFVLDILGGGETTRLKIGMGKPYGMGAVKIAPKLSLMKPTRRYAALFSEAAWDTGEAESIPQGQRLVQDFLSFMKQELGVEFTKLKRTHALLTMLQWPGPGDKKLTRYMEIEHADPHEKRGKRNEYKERPVLPSPFGVWSKVKKKASS